MKMKNSIISFPRSGSTLIRGLCEHLTDKPTVGIQLSEEERIQHPSHNDASILGFPNWKYDEKDAYKKSLIYKTHGSGVGPEIEDSENVVLIYRNPYDTIFSHMCREEWVSKINGELYVDHSKLIYAKNVGGYVEYLSLWFKNNLNSVFHRISENKNTMVVSFDALIKEPYETAKKIIDFFPGQEEQKNKSGIEDISRIIKHCRERYNKKQNKKGLPQVEYCEKHKDNILDIIKKIVGIEINSIETIMDAEESGKKYSITI